MTRCCSEYLDRNRYSRFVCVFKVKQGKREAYLVSSSAYMKFKLTPKVRA